MLLMQLVFNSSARGPNGLVIRASDQYYEGLGFESQLDPKFFSTGSRLISHFFSRNIFICEHLLLLTVNNIKPHLLLAPLLQHLISSHTSLLHTPYPLILPLHNSFNLPIVPCMPTHISLTCHFLTSLSTHFSFLTPILTSLHPSVFLQLTKTKTKMHFSKA